MGILGKIHSEETKKKMSESGKLAWKEGRKIPTGMKGKYHSEESKRKMSKSQTGKKLS